MICSGAADPEYVISYVPGTLTVTPAGTTLTPAAPSLLRSILTLRVTMGATLRSTVTGAPVPGQPVRFVIGSSPCTATTAANGVASCSVSVLNVLGLLLGQRFTATYAGNADHTGSQATGSAVTL